MNQWHWTSEIIWVGGPKTIHFDLLLLCNLYGKSQENNSFFSLKLKQE